MHRLVIAHAGDEVRSRIEVEVDGVAVAIGGTDTLVDPVIDLGCAARHEFVQADQPRRRLDAVPLCRCAAAPTGGCGVDALAPDRAS